MPGAVFPEERHERRERFLQRLVDFRLEERVERRWFVVMPDQFRTAGGWLGWMALEVADSVVLFETDEAAVDRSPGARGRAEDGEALCGHLRQVGFSSVGYRAAGIGEVSGRPQVVEG